MSDFKFEIYRNGRLVDEDELEGIAHLKYESSKLIGKSELRCVYNGSNYDPVLHFTTKYNDEVGGWVKL